MIGLHTNVLIRFLVADAPAQFARARRLILDEVDAGEPVFIGLLVLLETEWVLRSRYHLDKLALVATLSGLLDAQEVRLEEESSVEAALFLWQESQAEFADCLIGVRHQVLGCSATAPFDTRASKLPGILAA